MARSRTGHYLRCCPAGEWDDVRMEGLLSDDAPRDAEAWASRRRDGAPAFMFPWGRPPSADVLRETMGEVGVASLLVEADGLLEGRFRYFRRTEYELGHPPDWLKNAENGYRFDARRHWSKIADFDPRQGDVKLVWEPSRFASAWMLTRAWALTNNDAYAACFWEFFESWCRQNPPNRGPNWKCGQETSLRLMGWSFALYGLAGAPSSTPERQWAMLKAIAVSAQRVEPVIGYALSQNNNHGISEAAGLLTVGRLFPELRRAGHWAKTGRRLLERQLRRQIYADGSYVQQSFNYQRLMLHDSLWALGIERAAGGDFSAEAIEKLRRCYRMLLGVSDPSGRVPNYGKNDGALLMVLDSCDYLDYRPALQLAGHVIDGVTPIARGSWDEPVVWFGGAGQETQNGGNNGQPAGKASAPASGEPGVGGYNVILTAGSWAMVRAHSYKDRPADADALHVDLWWKGVNVLRDSGTYHYYDPAEPRFELYFAATRAHNCVEVDGLSQMDKASRFLWDRWLSAVTTRNESPMPGVHIWQGEHGGYRRLADAVTHRRTIIAVDGGTWIFIDDLLGKMNHDVRLFWHLGVEDACLDAERLLLSADVGGEPLELSVRAGGRKVAARCVSGHAESEDVLGWQSLYYGSKEAAPTLEVLLRQAELPVRLVTVLRLGQKSPQVDVAEDLSAIKCNVAASGWTMTMMPPGKGSVVVAAVMPEV